MDEFGIQKGYTDISDKNLDSLAQEVCKSRPESGSRGNILNRLSNKWIQLEHSTAQKK
uniref:Uncharacterized protein n=1 Tax=Moniliophthora roreri TaxID=221103 RepID=A0A0W0F9H6_MONRR